MIIKGLTFSYPGKLLFENKSFEFRETAIVYHLKGVNGSGKTTFLKIISGLLTKYQGEIKYDENLRYRSCLDFSGFDPDLNALTNILDINSNILNMDRVYLSSLIDRFQVNEWTKIKVKKLSKGTLTKFSLIGCFLAKPDFVILDEPMSGLDTDSQKILISIINDDFLDQKKVVLTTGHFENLEGFKNIISVSL